jgi:3-oxoacyl-[acyl-carrier-protein] synthase III
MPRAYISGTGYHLPQRVITNAELRKQIDSTEEWIVTHTGIVERRGAEAGQNTSDLGVLATRAALRRTGWKDEDLDLLICATSTPDALIPSTACYMGKKMGIDPVALDVNAACSGFVYGLAVADAMMQTGPWKRVAMCTAEKYTRVTDYTDRSSCIFFGDSAATVLLQTERPQVGFEIVDLLMANVNEGADYVVTPVGECFRQQGNKVKDYALKHFALSARTILGRNGLGVGDLRAFAGHQANLRVLELVANALDVPPEKHWHMVESCGNSGAAGAPLTFCSKVEQHEASLKAGDLFLVTVFGSGFTTGSVLLRRIDARS